MMYKDELIDTTQATTKRLASRHAPSQRTTHIGGSDWDLGKPKSGARARCIVGAGNGKH
jgi:hypothetical protein